MTVLYYAFIPYYECMLPILQDIHANDSYIVLEFHITK